MEKNNIFISDCGNYIAIRIPGPQPTFDVWRHDGSEFWEGTRYIPVPSGKEDCYNPRTVYTDEFTHPKKIVGSWTNLGHSNRKDEWIEAFELTLDNLETRKGIFVKFHTPLLSLAPRYEKRRQKQWIVTFSVGSTTYKFKEPLMLESEYIEGMLHLTHKEPTLSACGKSWGECQDIILEELAMLWEEYALAPDDELTPGAIVFKKKLLSMVEGAK